MDLARIVDHYQGGFMAKYAHRLSPAQHHALHAMLRCRTAQAGELHLRCGECAKTQWRPLSCGHRSCPKCQNHEASRWLDRQSAKLLPVDYFMLTFTLPFELRPLARAHPAVMYNILLGCAVSTLKTFGLNPKHLGADLGMTAVLHTHTRRLDYHPHVHLIVPGGGVDKRRRQWKKLKGKYLFNAFALAKVFRARCLRAMNETTLALPKKIPTKWVVHAKRVGSGKPALTYLSRYLYRGVISENAIVGHHDGKVTFRYTESRTGKTCYRSLPGEDFLWLVLQHVLPKGFRRVRDYGFLHGNAKKLLSLVQWVLQVIIDVVSPRPRPVFRCPDCHAPMRIIGIRRAWQSG